MYSFFKDELKNQVNAIFRRKNINTIKGVINKDQVFRDRKRTNLFKNAEQDLILWLVKRVPDYITSNFLTFLGGIGSLIVFFGFLLSAYVYHHLLLIAIGGLLINWIGDSLDGRLAYYRNTPRKWYGFALDIIMDWFSTVSIGFGYLIYADSSFKWLGFVFVALYGWAILITQLRYKISNEYTIDSGIAGPTELRILLALIFLTEVLFKGSINYLAIAISVTLFFINIKDTLLLLDAGNERDKAEKIKTKL